jgi:squalene-associated FAD-dependent desaturase
MSSKSVIVIGGGLAGLSSAVALADAGFRVRVLERRPFLGGRASSYTLPDGEHVDNCQHVTLGCCTNLDDFYRRVGAARKIGVYDRLVFVDRDGRRAPMQASALPAPLHLAASLALYPSLTWSERRSIGNAMLAIARRGGRNADGDVAGKSMLDWLRLHGQSESAIRRFWSVVLVSALNEELDRTDARYGLDVFWKAFLANRAGYRLGIPLVPLGELYDGCKAAIESRGGEVQLRASVRRLRVSEERVVAVEIDGGREESADVYVLAVPHDAVLALLPEQMVGAEPGFANLRCLRSSPITGVHFWFDRDVMSEPFLTLLDRTTQWIFNKSRLYGGPGDGRYLQLVVSASYDLLPRSRQEIIDLCLAELREVLPEAREAKLLKAVVIKEANATFSPEPGSDRWRPSQQTSLPNLFLAGDWTATGWPATMEGAVRSGYLAAEAILAAAGAPQRLLRPDLPPEGLARWCASRAAF